MIWRSATLFVYAIWRLKVSSFWIYLPTPLLLLKQHVPSLKKHPLLQLLRLLLKALLLPVLRALLLLPVLRALQALLRVPLLLPVLLQKKRRRRRKRRRSKVLITNIYEFTNGVQLIHFAVFYSYIRK